MELGLGKKSYNETEKQSEMEKDTKMYKIWRSTNGLSHLEAKVKIRSRMVVQRLDQKES